MTVKPVWGLIIAALLYTGLIFPMTSHLKNRPLQIKMGYFPEAKVIKYICADQKYVVADWAILKVLIYFGSLVEKATGKNIYAEPPDYPLMFKTLQTALRLEPYNMDAYYFAQAVFTWEIGRYREVNNMLEYGMKYRTWDYQLPFFVGFNSAYFLKDYPKAAEYMKKAAEISNNSLFVTLASRFFYEARNNDLAIAFIEAMEKGARDENEKKLYRVRHEALLAVKSIEAAAAAYHEKFGSYPLDPSLLVKTGLLPRLPRDPYGGEFYLESNGMARSTSNFAFAKQNDHAK